MKLRDRYKRLTFWNKIGFWGAICSIMAIIIIICSTVSNSISDHKEEAYNREELINKIDMEIINRLEKFKIELSKFFSDDWYATSEYKVEYLVGLLDAQSVIDEIIYVFPEFKDQTFVSLLHQLKKQLEYGKQSQINEALSTLSEIKHTLGKISNDMDDEELKIIIKKVNYLLDNELIPLRWSGVK